MPIPEEKYYAPVGAYNFNIDKNGLFTIVPTYRADRTVLVTKPEEYINPEFIVTPRSVKPLVDDAGKPAYSVNAYNIVLEEKHKPLNPYQYYMESKGVAPKDVEAEHLIQRYRADLAAERANLSPFIANLLTGMYATAAQEGWNNIKNGNYFTGAAEVLSPLMFGEDTWNKVAQGVYGGIHLLNKNGVPKTWEEIKKGNYERAALSGTGDLFNLTLSGVGGNLIYKSTLDLLASKGNTWARAKLVTNTLDNFTPITEHNIIIENIGTPKQSRMFSKGTYPIYTGPKHSIFEVVNTDGTVNPKAAMQILHEVANYFKLFGKGAYKMEERLENPKWHTLDPNTYLHTKNVALTAYQLPTPPGFTKQDLMIAALGHDFGKIVAGDGHGEISSSLIKQIFPDITSEQISAMAEHMQSNPLTILGQYTKAADIINGRGGIEVLLDLGESNLYNIIVKPKTTVGPVRGIEGTPTEIEISPEELYKLLQEQEGYYFLGHGTGRKPSGVSEAIFNNGLRVKNGDVLNTTIPLSESNLASWPHLNSEEVIILPGKVENMKYDYPYGRIPSDWFDTNTFHWNDNPGFSGRGLMAQENPHASFTESVIGNIPGVYTKPEAVLGSYNTRTHILRLNPNSQYRFSFGETAPDIKSFSGPSGQLAPRPVNYLSTNPQENPLLSRMMRLSEKRQIGDVAPNLTVIFKLNVSPRDIVRTVSKNHPELNSNQIKLITQTLMNNKRGAYIPIGNNAGETTGGISIVEVEDAINYLKSKGIKNPTERDIRIMLGHELGHGVKLTPEALNAVRGYEAPEEFYTQIGQVLDNAGITSTLDMPVQFNDLLKLGEKYLAEGNLDNGVSKALNFLKRFKGNSIKDIIKQQNIMKLINRFSVGILGIYTGSQLANNDGKVL